MTIQFWNAQKNVNTTTGAGPIDYQAQSTQLVDATIVVTWVENNLFTLNYDVKFQRFDVLGNPLGIEILAHSVSPVDKQAAPRIVALAAGGFTIIYQDAPPNTAPVTLTSQAFSATGVPVGAAVVGSSDPSEEYGAVLLGNALVDAVYELNDQVVLTMFDPFTGLTNGEVINADGANSGAAIAAANGTFIIAYNDGADDGQFVIKDQDFGTTLAASQFDLGVVGEETQVSATALSTETI